MRRMIIPFLFIVAAHAQAPPNTVAICTEKCTVTASTAANSYMFGAPGKFNSLTAKYPLSVDCTVACPQLGGDPAPGLTKTLYAIQGSTAYTVTWRDIAGKVTVTPVPVKPMTITCVASVPPVTDPNISYTATCKVTP